MHWPDPVEVPPLPPSRRRPRPVRRGHGESGLDAARRLTAGGPGPVAVLNFASARNPGGGYLNVARRRRRRPSAAPPRCTRA
ncbi:poly(ADP-ribose) glycohydrolase domain-containing protein [Streptomyces sp. KL116D]|uniref:poly(ADP-ribose) glycohydrolase domain-containing protein n=1 Tax=Streptomyces sp. KL116D TaxID=3045152 RepID=UPI003556EF4D